MLCSTDTFELSFHEENETEREGESSTRLSLSSFVLESRCRREKKKAFMLAKVVETSAALRTWRQEGENAMVSEAKPTSKDFEEEGGKYLEAHQVNRSPTQSPEKSTPPTFPNPAAPPNPPPCPPPPLPIPPNPI